MTTMIIIMALGALSGYLFFRNHSHRKTTKNLRKNLALAKNDVSKAEAEIAALEERIKELDPPDPYQGKVPDECLAFRNSIRKLKEQYLWYEKNNYTDVAKKIDLIGRALKVLEKIIRKKLPEAEQMSDWIRYEDIVKNLQHVLDTELYDDRVKHPENHENPEKSIKEVDNILDLLLPAIFARIKEINSKEDFDREVSIDVIKSSVNEILDNMGVENSIDEMASMVDVDDEMSEIEKIALSMDSNLDDDDELGNDEAVKAMLA